MSCTRLIGVGLVFLLIDSAFESADVEKSGKIGSNNVVEILETLIGKGLTEHEQEIVKGEISF